MNIPEVWNIEIVEWDARHVVARGPFVWSDLERPNGDVVLPVTPGARLGLPFPTERPSVCDPVRARVMVETSDGRPCVVSVLSDRVWLSRMLSQAWRQYV